MLFSPDSDRQEMEGGMCRKFLCMWAAGSSLCWGDVISVPSGMDGPFYRVSN